MKLCLWSPEFFWTIIVSICFHWLSMIPLFTESHKKTCWWKTTIWSPIDVWCYFTGWFRPIFDIPIPPLYQPSTIETVARDRSPRHSAEKWKFWVWKPSKKLVKPFPTLWKYRYICISLSKLEVTLFLEPPNSRKQNIWTKCFLRKIHWILKDCLYASPFGKSFHLMQETKDRSPVKIGIAAGGCFFLWCHAINFHSPALKSQALWYWKGSKALWSVGAHRLGSIILYGKQFTKICFS